MFCFLGFFWSNFPIMVGFTMITRYKSIVRFLWKALHSLSAHLFCIFISPLLYFFICFSQFWDIFCFLVLFSLLTSRYVSLFLFVLTSFVHTSATKTSKGVGLGCSRQGFFYPLSCMWLLSGHLVAKPNTVYILTCSWASSTENSAFFTATSLHSSTQGQELPHSCIIFF